VPHPTFCGQDFLDIQDRTSYSLSIQQQGYWKQIEIYIRQHSDAEITHDIYPECVKIFHPEYYKKICDKENNK
jgi:hypothetical protein